MDDKAIIALFLCRDESAIRALSEKYGSLCRRVSMNILKNAADADECVNDAYLRVWNAIPPANPDRLDAYLLKITRNLSIDRLRERNADVRAASEYALSLEELAECAGNEAADSGEDDETAVRALGESIDRFLRGERPVDRAVFLLRYFEAEPVRSIAEKLSLREGTVKSILSRTREKLRNYLESEGYSV